MPFADRRRAVARRSRTERHHHAVLIEHDPEKWVPVSRLREALAWFGIWLGASAGEGRSEKIMLQQYFKAG
jgi:hypothetical protein